MVSRIAVRARTNNQTARVWLIALSNQARMPPERFGRPARPQAFPEKFRQRRHEERFGRRLERANQKIIRNDKRQHEADNESAALEPGEDKNAESKHDEKRLPDFDVADRRHEQVERRMRPSFVDQMKEPLVHSRQF